MRKSAVGKPKLFIETLRVDDQRILFEFPDRAAVVERIVGIAPKLALLRPSVGVDDPVVVVAAANEDKDALAITVLDKLYSIRKLELAGSARRHAVQKRR